jgi:hypothetical protein
MTNEYIFKNCKQETQNKNLLKNKIDSNSMLIEPLIFICYMQVRQNSLNDCYEISKDVSSV